LTATLLRFIQGAGDSLVSTSAYSIITIEFPQMKQSYIGYCQSAVGIGLMMGPCLGQALYTLFNYQLTFYIFAGFFTLAMLVLIFMVPSHLNRGDDILSKEEIDMYFEQLKSTEGGRASSYEITENRRPILMRSEGAKTTSSKAVTYWMFLKNRRAMMATVSAVIAMIFMLFFYGILTMHLISDMDIGENSAGKIRSFLLLS
jgi:MFS family permease